MTALLQNILTTPIIAFVLLLVLGIEAVFLLLLWKSQNKGVPPVQVFTFLGAGAAFSLALGAVLAQLNVIWLALCLSFAFVFHILDLKQRWQTKG